MAKAASATRPALSRDRILRAAVKLADNGGLASLSMRHLGATLGVEAMSLYNHVNNKEDLLDGMVDIIFTEIDQPPAGHGDWRSLMRLRAISARQVLARHRWAIALIDSRNSPGPATMKHFDDALGCLRAAGFSIEMTVRAYGVIHAYVYGFVLAFNQESRIAQVQQIIEGVGPDQYPHAIDVTRQHMLQPAFDHTQEFDRGLDLVLDGIAQALHGD
jgi:AcrR family transcriptional regulator